MCCHLLFCFSYFVISEVDQFVVRVGEHDLQSDVEKHQDIHVTKAIVHPHYDKGKYLDTYTSGHVYLAY